VSVAWALAHPEQGAQPWHVQPRPGSIDDGVKSPFHHRAGREDQVAAVLDLIDRIGVAEAAACLVGEVQAEAEARGVDPSVQDLAQTPYRLRLGQGVCDLSQVFGFIHPSEAVAFLREADAARL